MTTLSLRLKTFLQRIRTTIGVIPGVIWTLVLLVLLILFLERDRGEVWRVWFVIRRANIWWVLAAIAGQLVFIGLMTRAQVVIFQRLQHAIRWSTVTSIYLQREVAATVIPLGGPSSMVVSVRLFGNQGVEPPDALFASLLTSIVGLGSFILYLIPVLAWITFVHALNTGVIIAALILLLFSLLLIVGLFLGLRPAGFPASIAHLIPQKWQEPLDQIRAHKITASDLALPLGYSLIGEVANVAILYSCLLALRLEPSLLAVLAGYAVGTLFTLVAPIFRGLGFVELGMAVTLSRFGIPSSAALAAVLLFRFCELWLPLVLGVIVQAQSRPGLRQLPPHLPAFATGFTGFLTVLSVMAPHLPRRFEELNDLHQYNPLTLSDASRSVTLGAGFLLIFLSYHLFHRKQVAWFLAVSLLAATVVTHVLKRHDELISIIAALNLVLLLAYRRRFRVRSDVPTMRIGLLGFSASFLFALLYGTIGFWLLDRRTFDANFTLRESLIETIHLFFSFGTAGLVPHTAYADWFLDSFNVVGILSIAYALFSVLRPVVWRRHTLPAEREKARQLIETYGDSSLDLFKTWPDKLFFFSSTGKGVVAYGTTLSSAIALGDPVATDETEFRTVLTEFLDFCDANNWRVAFHQTPETHLAAYREAGLIPLKIGEDAIVNLTDFSLSGSKMKSLRSVVNRFERDGYRSVRYEPPLSEAVLNQTREVSQEWLALPGRRERGFTLGSFDDDYVRGTPVVTVEDANGHILAFANIIPDGAEGETTLDLMRHRAEAPNGSMDFLFIKLMEQARDQGFRSFSLGMVPFAAVGSTPDSPPRERAIGLLSDHLNRFFSVSGLRYFKDKFHPVWESRYLVYQSDVSLPMVTLALIRLSEKPDVKMDALAANGTTPSEDLVESSV